MKMLSVLYLILLSMPAAAIDLSSDDWWITDHTNLGQFAIKIDGEVLEFCTLRTSQIERRPVTVTSRTGKLLQGSYGKSGGFVIRSAGNRARYEEGASQLYLRDPTRTELRRLESIEEKRDTPKEVCARVARCGRFAYGIIGSAFDRKKELGNGLNRQRCENSLRGLRAIIESRGMELPPECNG